jgi:hypothetical protein
MSESFEIILALESSLTPKSLIPNVNKFSFCTSRVNDYISNLVMDSGTWRHRDLSSSFRYRIKRRLLGDIPFNKINGIQKIKFFFRFATNLARYISLGNYLSNYILRYISQLLQKRERQILNALLTIKPDIVLIWSQTLEPASSAFIYNSRLASIPNLLIADNWDNLFSKTVFPITPDFVGCFGKQSADFGSKLHAIPRNRFVELGSARFDVYRKLPRVETRKLVVFAGSSMPEDDENVLRLIDQVREDVSVQGSTKDLGWRYRPHPVPQHAIRSFAESFPKIEFTSFTGENQWPNLGDSVVELANTRVAICMPTSYLLEALVCEVPVIIPIFTDMVGLTTSTTLMGSLEHLKDVSELPGVSLARSPSEFRDLLTQFIVSDVRIKPTAELDFFVNWTQSSFLENLTKAIFKVLNQEHLLE